MKILRPGELVMAGGGAVRGADAGDAESWSCLTHAGVSVYLHYCSVHFYCIKSSILCSVSQFGPPGWCRSALQQRLASETKSDENKHQLHFCSSDSFIHVSRSEAAHIKLLFIDLGLSLYIYFLSLCGRLFLISASVENIGIKRKEVMWHVSVSFCCRCE